MTLRVFSYGGGVQSTAALVLAAQGTIDFKTFLFCNVGEDSENPATLDYVRDYARPFAEKHDIEFIELQRTRFGEPETIYQRLTRPGSRSIGIPVRMAGSGAPGNRACTGDFKIKVIAKWLREHGATPLSPATCGLGISLDEWQRMRSESGIAYEKLEYPSSTCVWIGPPARRIPAALACRCLQSQVVGSVRFIPCKYGRR